MLEFFTEPFSFAFMQRAALEILIIGALTGLVGSLVVLRGLSFIGDALIHSVFPGVIVAAILGFNIMIGAFVFGGATALAIGVASRNRRVSHDAAIGVVFAAFFALGFVLVSWHDDLRQDVTSVLFGNILGISRGDVIVSAVLALLVAGITIGLLKELLLVAFDPTLAASTGYPVFLLEIVLLLLVTTTVVVSLQAVGNLLILALLITPAAAARLLTDRLYRMIGLSMALACFSGIAGLIVSFHADTSASGTIALTTTALFVLSMVFAPQHGYVSQWLQGRRGEHHEHHFHEQHEEVDIR